MAPWSARRAVGASAPRTFPVVALHKAGPDTNPAALSVLNDDFDPMGAAVPSLAVERVAREGLLCTDGGIPRGAAQPGTSLSALWTAGPQSEPEP